MEARGPGGRVWVAAEPEVGWQKVHPVGEGQDQGDSEHSLRGREGRMGSVW